MENSIPKALYGSPDNPIKIENLEIPCYVLDDNRRVLHQRGMVSSLGMARGGSSKGGGDRLHIFIAGKGLEPFISKELYEVTANPIKFRTTSGNMAYGYNAEILADICEAVLAARKAGALQKQQLHIADRCEILMRGFARVGIIALVDEATGYQEVRKRHALQAILDKYLLKEYAAWAKTFPDEFYKELFRLRGWSYDPSSVRRPSVIGKYTNDLIYERLAPGILEELKKRNPLVDNKYRKVKHHQYLTEDIGHPALRQHMYAVITLMRASSNWNNLYRSIQRALPKKGIVELQLDVWDYQ